MSEIEKQELQEKILDIENSIKNAKESIAKIEQSIKDVEIAIQALKDIAWDKESKKESSKMYKVLENKKPSTIVKSNVGNVIVDEAFMEKEKKKHLDNQALRGMISTEELLSFPKVARNVEAEYNEEINDYTWKAKANDDNILAYGSREYVKDDKEINRLLTAHSKTERGQRQADRVSSATYFNDPDFRGSVNETIPQKDKDIDTPQQNHTKHSAVSESALKRMQQRIAEVAKKGKSYTKDKQQSLSKGKEK